VGDAEDLPYDHALLEGDVGIRMGVQLVDPDPVDTELGQAELAAPAQGFGSSVDGVVAVACPEVASLRGHERIRAVRMTPQRLGNEPLVVR